MILQSHLRILNFIPSDICSLPPTAGPSHGSRDASGRGASVCFSLGDPWRWRSAGQFFQASFLCRKSCIWSLSAGFLILKGHYTLSASDLRRRFSDLREPQNPPEGLRTQAAGPHRGLQTPSIWAGPWSLNLLKVPGAAAAAAAATVTDLRTLLWGLLADAHPTLWKRGKKRAWGGAAVTIWSGWVGGDPEQARDRKTCTWGFSGL